MKQAQSFFSLIFMLTTTMLFSQKPPILWAQQMQGNYNTYPVAMVNDPEGNLYTAISFAQKMSVGSTTISGGGYVAICLLKTNPAGQVLWYRLFTGGTGHYASSLACDAEGNVYMSGVFTGNALFNIQVLVNAGGQDGFVLKFSKNGSYKWAKAISGSGSDYARSLAIDGAGHLYLAGDFENSLSLGNDQLNAAGLNDIFLTQLDTANGAFLWSKRWGSTQMDEAGPLICDAAGNLVVAGHYSVITQVDNNSLSSNGFRDAYLCSVDPVSGTVLWTEQIGSNGNDYISALTRDSKGFVYAATNYAGVLNYASTQQVCTGNTCMTLVKLRADNGSAQFVKNFDNTGIYRYISGLRTGPGDEIYLAGTYDGTLVMGSQTLSASGNSDAFLARADTLGNILWSDGKGGAYGDLAYALSADAFGNVYTGGYFAGTFNYGSTVLSILGSSAGFMARWGNASVNPGLAEQTLSENIEVYPNPFQEQIWINDENQQFPLLLRLSDVSGRLVYEQQLRASGEAIRLPRELASGLYYLLVQNNAGQRSTQKLVKH